VVADRSCLEGGSPGRPPNAAWRLLEIHVGPELSIEATLRDASGALLARFER